MSEFNEELLNDETDDFPELGEAEEEALLQEDDDGDVLKIAPEDEEEESPELDLKEASDTPEEKRASRQDKFATERQIITAPEPSVSSIVAENQPNRNKFNRPNFQGRGRGRGGRQYHQRGTFQQHNQGRQYNNHGNHRGTNKTVLINPRFQGVVHVNSNGESVWDTPQPQPFQHYPWGPRNAPPNMGAPMQMQMQHMQGPQPLMQFTPPMQQFQGSPHGQPVPHLGPPEGQQFIPHQQQEFIPQPLPPGVAQTPMQPPNLPAPSSYWDGQNQFPQGPNQQQMNPYVQNFEPPSIMMNTNQPPMQLHPQNMHYNNNNNNQFGNNGPPMHRQQNFNMNPNFQNRGANMRPQQDMHPNRREKFSPKRKVASASFVQNKKRLVHERLGTAEQTHVKVKNTTVKSDDRSSMVKEVTVTSVTTVKIEEDEETRDLRLKIEEQKRKREQVLLWKELRRKENLKQIETQETPSSDQEQKILPVQQRRKFKERKEKPAQRPQQQIQAQSSKRSKRMPVLQPVRQIDEKIHFLGRARNKNINQSLNQRVITAPVLAAPVAPAQVRPAVEEPEVHLDQKRLSTFLADRKVLVKDEALMSTRKVVINNIATSTGDKKIFQICKNIGEVQKLHRDKNDRHATITFKSVASAHAFFKKYQRHMLDLSMIEVSLTPESDGQE